MQSPSPTTPDFPFDPLQNNIIDEENYYHQGNQGFFSKQLTSSYPLPNVTHQALPYHTAPNLILQAQRYRHVQEPLQQPLPVPHSIQQPLPQTPPQTHLNGVDSESLPTGPLANARSKKNSYPCPMAKQYGCNDFFTTSGHAARHAKKHTGKKDARCPECNKAFTRKDNMEQHRRTHANGRNANKGTESAAKKAKQQAKRPKPTVLQSIAPPLPQMNTMLVDPSLTADPAFAMSPVEPFAHHAEPSPYFINPSYPAGSYPGLDALASVATGEQRKYEP